MALRHGPSGGWEAPGSQPPVTLRMLFRTWNVNGRLADARMVADFLRTYQRPSEENGDEDNGNSSGSNSNSTGTAPDVVVVSLQELVPLTTENVVMSHEKSNQNSEYWEAACVSALARLHDQPYTSVAARSLVGVFTMVRGRQVNLLGVCRGGLPCTSVLVRFVRVSECE
jgi:hypothetical protein